MQRAFFGDNAIDLHQARIDEFLHASAGEFGTIDGDEAIEAGACVSGSGFELAMSRGRGCGHVGIVRCKQGM